MKSLIGKTLLVVLGLVMVAAFICLLVAPLVISEEFVFDTDKVSNYSLEELRNHYLVIGTISATLTTILGLILGFFYYYHKLSVDKELLLDEKRHNVLASIHGELNTYDELVDRIFYKLVKSQRELDMVRDRIRKVYDRITTIIDEKAGLMEWESDTIRELIEVHKFVDNSKHLMDDKFSAIKGEAISIDKSRYDELLSRSIRICLKR